MVPSFCVAFWNDDDDDVDLIGLGHTAQDLVTGAGLPESGPETFEPIVGLEQVVTLHLDIQASQKGYQSGLPGFDLTPIK